MKDMMKTVKCPYFIGNNGICDRGRSVVGGCPYPCNFMGNYPCNGNIFKIRIILRKQIYKLEKQINRYRISKELFCHNDEERALFYEVFDYNYPHIKKIKYFEHKIVEYMTESYSMRKKSINKYKIRKNISMDFQKVVVFLQTLIKNDKKEGEKHENHK